MGIRKLSLHQNYFVFKYSIENGMISGNPLGAQVGENLMNELEDISTTLKYSPNLILMV